MQVKDYMTSDLIWANLKDGLHQTYTRMQERNIRHMPVLDDEERLVGIITDRDLRRPEWLDDDPNVALTYRLDNSVKVESAMSTEPNVLLQEAPIKEAVGQFLDTHYGAFPVVNADRKLVGILSAIDVIQAFQDVLNHQG